MRLLLAFFLFFSAQAFAFNNKVFLTVSLSKNIATLTKITPKGERMELRGWILPARPESLRLNQPFRPQEMREQFRSRGGNATLENLILFDNNKALRTSRMFRKMWSSGRKVSGFIVMEPEFGSIVFDTIRTYGVDKTVITINK